MGLLLEAPEMAFSGLLPATLAPGLGPDLWAGQGVPELEAVSLYWVPRKSFRLRAGFSSHDNNPENAK